MELLGADFRDAACWAAQELRAAPRTRRLEKLLAVVRLGGEPKWSPFADQIVSVIRADQPLKAEEGAAFHAHLERVGAEPARELWETLPAPAPLLDLGGGTGTYAKAFPGPSRVLDRIGEQPFDLLSGVYPGEQGTALLCNVLHLFGPEDCARIVAKAARCARLVVVKDLDPRTFEGTLFALDMALFTEAGDVHPQAAIAGWLKAAGLPEPRVIRLRSAPSSFVLASP